MADNEHKSDDGHADDHGDTHGDDGGGEKHAKASGGGSILRNPVTWAVAGAGALLVAVFASGVPVSNMGTSPSSYDATDSSSDVGTSSTGERRSTGRRYSARTCASMVRQARDAYGSDWESELSRKVRADCERAIQEARRDDRRSPQQAEGPRGRAPGADDVEVQRLNVAYGDLDLRTSAGAERFLQRLKNAAIRVCGGRPDIRDLREQRAFKDCVDRNMDNAVAQIRAPRVTELHQRAG